MRTLALLLTIATVLSGTVSQAREITQAQRERSVYMRQDPIFPFGVERTFRLLRELKGLGVQHLVLELRVAVDDARDNRVNFGMFRGHTPDQIQSFIAGIHNHEMAVTIKPIFVLRDGVTQVVPDPKDVDQFVASYSAVVSYVAKLGKTASVDEVVLGTGLGNILCSRPDLAAGLVNLAKNVLPSYGDQSILRLDFSSPAEALQVQNCVNNGTKGNEVAAVLFKFEKIGVDLSVNPDAATVIQILKNGMLASRVSFDGQPADQAARASELKAQLATLGSLALPVTWGTFTTNIYNRGLADTSDSPRGKPLQELMKSWFLK